MNTPAQQDACTCKQWGSGTACPVHGDLTRPRSNVHLTVDGPMDEATKESLAAMIGHVLKDPAPAAAVSRPWDDREIGTVLVEIDKAYTAIHGPRMESDDDDSRDPFEIGEAVDKAFKRLVADLTAAQAERDAARSRVEELSAEVAALRGELSHAKLERDGYIQRCDRVEADSMDLKEELDRLNCGEPAKREGRAARTLTYMRRYQEVLEQRDEAIAQRDTFKAKYDTLVRESGRTCYVCDTCGRLRTTRECIVCERDEAIAQRDHWKANHDRMAEVKRAVLERPDLGDRSGRVVALQAECDRLRLALSRLRKGLAADSAMTAEEMDRVADAALEGREDDELAKLRARCEGVEKERDRFRVALSMISNLYGGAFGGHIAQLGKARHIAQDALGASPLPPSPADGGSRE